MTDREAPPIVFRDAALLDPEASALAAGRSILVESGRIAEIGDRTLAAPGALEVDLRGRTLMPGLIDAHVHVNAVTGDLSAIPEWSASYVAARASHVLRGMLLRGFTTVRDVAGADYGLADAVDEGWFEGPRLIFGGKALSQTGGHGDARHRGRDAIECCYCSPALNRVCDGVAEVRKAARDEIRRGARHLKIMLGGGVASPTDRVDSVQFSIGEIEAVVEEAENANLYVTGHAYTAEAVNRGLRCGVRCIEHGNLIDGSSVELFLERRAFYVPTLATYAALAEHGLEFGLPAASHRKVFEVLDKGRNALELAHRAGVEIAYGTDLLGGMHEYQLSEFQLRSEVQPLSSIVRAATSTAARLLRMEGQVGRIAPGAFADLLVVDGDPLTDLSALTNPEQRLPLIMKAGRVIKDALALVPERGAAR
ncbi:MAG TPA: amidohydrolase family protein [Candidatus Dormibacteraeota bacterium]